VEVGRALGGCARLAAMNEDELRALIREDEKLLRRAETALTQIKVAQGLTDPQASALAALRIRLRGSPGKSLDDLLESAGDVSSSKLDEMLERPEEGKGSLDDLFATKPKPKPDWPSG
jgi:hypothetical protein